MVIEGIITTENSDGSLHVAPIGPHVDRELSSWVLKPFQTSTTFSNLKSRNRCVFHVTDDALLMAAAVLGLCNNPQDENIRNACAADFDSEWGWLLRSACRTFALSVEQWDDSQPRAVAVCKLCHTLDIRPFWGWNRAAHSILEVSILASRQHLLESHVIVAELDRHGVIVQKTAGSREMAAWELLKKRLSP
ncbi:MAG: DUF447 domain-containing protein [Pirellula sp.]